jgi:hypothetical protein
LAKECSFNFLRKVWKKKDICSRKYMKENSSHKEEMMGPILLIEIQKKGLIEGLEQ